MVLKLTQDLSQTDIEVSIIYPEKNKIMERIVSFLNSVGSEIECNFGSSTRLLNTSDIYYIECFNNKTIIYCENEKYQIKERLYQIYEKLTNKGFAQISKYCIVNTNKIRKFNSLLNSRMEAELTNEARLFITRKYLNDIKRMLKDE